MGMLGQWVSAPVPTRRMDSVLNGMTLAELNALKSRIKDNGELFLDFRDDVGFSGGNIEDDHVVRHWFNDRDEGWWPEFPVEEIRTETIYRIADLLAAAKEAGLQKIVSSLWMCPSTEFFGALVHDTDNAIFVIHLTPPEGGWALDPHESPNRPRFRALVTDFFERDLGHFGQVNAQKIDAATYSLEKMGIPDRRGGTVDPELFWMGRRIAIINPADGTRSFRTVTGVDAAQKTIQTRQRGDFTPNAAVGFPAPTVVADGGDAIIKPMSDVRAKPKANTQLNTLNGPQPFATGTWTITGRDLGTSTNNVKTVENHVVGVDVRQNWELPVKNLVG